MKLLLQNGVDVNEKTEASNMYRLGMMLWKVWLKHLSSLWQVKPLNNGCLRSLNKNKKKSLTLAIEKMLIRGLSNLLEKIFIKGEECSG